MKLILMVADAGGLDRIREDLIATDAPGYTALPVIEGAGRTGLHAGNRVHPGALVAVLVVESDERAPLLFEALARRRDAAGDSVTRLFVLPVEQGR